MIFTEFRFLFFFLVAFGVTWSLRGNGARKRWLLLCSYVFYGAWDVRFLGLIVGSTYLDYLVGLGLSRTDDPKRRRAWLTLSLVGNLGVLAFFKYTDFFIASGADFLSWLGLPLSATTLGIVLPVGISFYTFQTLSYSIDVFRRRLEPCHDLLDLAVFVGFFPQLVAGPIVRASDFLYQLKAPRLFRRVDVRGCLVIFLIGYFKKAVLSDNLSQFVDAYFGSPATYTAASSWTATLAWMVQVYCDFSGYSDMALGTAGLLGYNLCDNFAHPYFATNIGDLWRRWHISLSTWLRDYLYIPLGGSRVAPLRRHANILVVMALCGLWHGAAWNFVAWGVTQGAGIMVYRTWHERWGRRLEGHALHALAAWALTLWYTCIAWAVFRAPDWPALGEVLRSFVLLRSPGEQVLADRLGWIVLACLVLHWLSWRGVLDGWYRRLPGWVFAAAYGGLAAVTLVFIRPQAEAFVYFQF